MLALLVGPMKADLGLSDTQIGVLQGLAFALFYSLAGVPIGWAVDRFSRRWILFAGVTLWSISAASCGLARGFWQLFAGRAMIGVGEATMTPSTVSLIGDLFPQKLMGRAFGIYSLGFYLGSGIALGLGGFIIALLSSHSQFDIPLIGFIAPWQSVFLVTGLAGLPIALLAFLIHDPRTAPDTQSPRPSSRTALHNFFRSRSRVAFHGVAAFSLLTFITYAIGAWTPTFLTRRFGLPVDQIGWMLGATMATAGAIGAVAGGIVIDRVFNAGRQDAYFLVPGIMELVALFFLVGAYLMPTAPAMLASLFMGLAAHGVAGPAAYATWRTITTPDERGVVTALATLCMGVLGAGLGPISVAMVTDYILGDEGQIGLSISLVLGCSIPLMVLLFLSGRRPLRDVQLDGAYATQV